MANLQNGNNTPGLVNVNSDYELQVALTKTLINAGYVTAVAENDNGSLFGSKRVKSLTTSEDSRLQVGLTTPLYNYNFNTTVQDTAQWRYTTATMQTTWSATGVLLNSNSNTATGTGTVISTYRQFSDNLYGGLQYDFNLSLTGALLPNQEITVGRFIPGSGTAVPSEGVYFKLTTAGLFGFTNYNASEANITGQLTTAESFTPDVNYKLSIVVYDNFVLFLRDGVLLTNGVLQTPVGLGNTTGTGTFPLAIQFRNNGAVSGSPVAQLKVVNVAVFQLDANLGLNYPTIQSLLGLMGSQATSGNPQGSTAFLSNNVNAAGGTSLGNTTSNLGNGLGGQFLALPVLASSTDGILCSYQVPVGSTTITPRTLLVYGVRIQGAVNAAFTGGPVVYQYSLAYGHTAVSLATTETPSSKSPRKIGLGYESYPSTSVQGTIGQTVYMPFVSPIVVNPGEFIAIVAKNVGPVTTAGSIAFIITFDACWI